MDPHCYKEIKAKNVRHVSFTFGDIIVTMKNGNVYGKAVVSDKSLGESTWIRYIEEDDLLKTDVDDVVSCDEYMLSKIPS